MASGPRGLSGFHDPEVFHYLETALVTAQEVYTRRHGYARRTEADRSIHIEKMSGLEFSAYCGRCFAVISPQRGGSVLSCGDFLCAGCAQTLLPGSTCPSCGRSGIRAAFLNDHLPEEVKVNIADPTRQLESLFQVLGFQTRYYKTIIRKLTCRLQESEQEIIKKSNTIREFEARLAEQHRNQSFFSKDSIPPTQVINEKYRQDGGIHHRHAQSSFFSSQNDSSMDTQGNHYGNSRIVTNPSPSGYYDEKLGPSANNPSHHPSPMTQRKHDQYSEKESISNRSFQRQGSSELLPPEQELPREYYLKGTNTTPLVHEGYGRLVSNEEVHQERKRVFTPSRTVFSTANQRGAVMSPKIRSINEPFVTSPSQPSFNPLKAGRVVELYCVNHQQTETRTSFSPMSNFLRTSHK